MKLGDACVRSMSGFHQMPDSSGAAEKVPSMIWYPPRGRTTSSPAGASMSMARTMRT